VRSIVRVRNHLHAWPREGFESSERRQTGIVLKRQCESAVRTFGGGRVVCGRLTRSGRIRRSLRTKRLVARRPNRSSERFIHIHANSL
jgi:hypothetical protein